MNPGFILLFKKASSTDQGPSNWFGWYFQGIVALFNGFLQLLKQAHHGLKVVHLRLKGVLQGLREQLIIRSQIHPLVGQHVLGGPTYIK
jgi:hypothetical protein